MQTRLTEIDSLRGLALVAMLCFHAAIDGILLGFWDFNPYGSPLIFFVRAIQILFLALVGVSIALSSRSFMEQLTRGVMIFWFALLVSLGTAILFPEEYVRFGVLHFIGVAVPLVRLFKGRPWFSALTLLASLLAPWSIPDLHGSMLDYFPIFPWLAAPLGGLIFGEWIYLKGLEPFKFLNSIKLLPAMGRHSLAIYLLHQPILYFTLWGLKTLTL